METPNGWTVTIEAIPGTAYVEDFDETLFDVSEKLADHGATVSSTTANDRISVTLSIDTATDGITATEQARWLVHDAMEKHGLLGWHQVRYETMTFAEHDALLEQPQLPELVGVAEIADILGVSRQRASELQTRAGFPAPIAVLRSGPVWARPSLNRFIEGWARTPGRPRRDDSL